MGQFIQSHKYLIVILLLLTKFILGILVMSKDSATMDEIAHIPSGYSYLAYSDYRLNPEHPPLLKDLAGLPLLFLDLDFPKDHVSWTQDVNGQWEVGWHFLYHYGNDADLILFLSRLSLLLLSVFFGWLIYAITKKLFGLFPALLALFFYALSPNFLGHSHLITTDMGIAAFIFLALASLAIFLKNPSGKTLIFATLALAAAHLAKFSSVLLIPFYLGIFFIVIIAAKQAPKLNLPGVKKIKRLFWKKAWLYGLSFVIIMLGSLLIVWAFYSFHTLNFPPDKQAELIRTSIASQPDWIKESLVKMSYIKPLQPLAQYLLGVAMVFTRVAGGNTTFFLGQVSNQSFKWYFPVSYLLKTPLAFLILLIFSIVLSLKNIFKTNLRQFFPALINYANKHIAKVIFLLFIFYYAFISITGNLNLGIRHLFPILPLIYILTSVRVSDFWKNLRGQRVKKTALLVLGLLLLWFASAAAISFPHYIAYHNEIIGGGGNAYRVFTDSNVDWGQDLRRLTSWLKERPEIENIRVDYFGGGYPPYYLCQRKFDEQGQLIRSYLGYDCQDSPYQEWHVEHGQVKGWLAVSVTFLQNAKYYAQAFGQPDYDWLRWREPYAKIGNSIFVYEIK